MQSVNIVKKVDVERTSRVKQLEGLFDVPPNTESQEVWDVCIDYPDSWSIGLVVGPSGSGKTTIINDLYKNAVLKPFVWDNGKSILDSFPNDLDIHAITRLLSSVGFSSPPLWVRPFKVLSNGQRFRVEMARALAENKDLIVVDEFTSVIDRTVAKIGSAAISKAVRRAGNKFIASSCHYDIIEWLEPDWVYDVTTGKTTRGRHRRPKIELTVKRVRPETWRLFKKYHYLNTSLNKSANCFGAFIDDRIVCFCSWLHFPHSKVKNMKKEHRTVTLPDYQGVGIGNAVSDEIASFYKENGFRPTSTTSQKAMITHRIKSSKWALTSSGMGTKTRSKTRTEKQRFKTSTKRITYSFEFVG